MNFLILMCQCLIMFKLFKSWTSISALNNEIYETQLLCSRHLFWFTILTHSVVLWIQFQIFFFFKFLLFRPTFSKNIVISEACIRKQKTFMKYFELFFESSKNRSRFRNAILFSESIYKSWTRLIVHTVYYLLLFGT